MDAFSLHLNHRDKKLRLMAQVCDQSSFLTKPFLFCFHKLAFTLHSIPLMYVRILT